MGAYCKDLGGNWPHYNSTALYHLTIIYPQKLLTDRYYTTLQQLEQLERLHSEMPAAAPWLPIPVIHVRSQVKTRPSQSYKFQKKLPKVQILQETLHVTHLLKLLDKMHKYEMDPTKTVGATEQTWDARRTERQTDGWTDGVKLIYPPTTSLCRGYNRYRHTH